MKQMFIALVCGLFVLPGPGRGSNSRSAAKIDEPLSLSVRVQSRHVSYFEVCVPVRINEPFRIVWGDQKVKDSVAGIVNSPIGDDYPASIAISEGNGQCREQSEPKLKLDEPREGSNLVSLAFNHIDTYRFVLSKKPCQ
jgi:hypothetical protein